MKKAVIAALTIILGASMLFAQTTMRTSLRDASFEGSVSGFGVLPATDPYLSQVTVKDALPATMVDWVLVELRSSVSGATVASAVGCLLSDGSVTDTTGLAGLTFEGLESSASYYIVVKHRNHLSIMSATAVQIDETNGTPEFDFTAGSAYSTGDQGLAQKLVGSEYAMYAGDGDDNDAIQTADKSLFWDIQAGLSGYRPADFDLNGFVQTNDNSAFYQYNVGKASQVPAQ